MDKIIISECTLVSVEKYFHLRILLNGNEYFFIAETLYLPDLDSLIIKSVKRGITYWDCQLKIKKSDKKKIKELISIRLKILLT